jgi:hypothetical protein
MCASRRVFTGNHLGLHVCVHLGVYSPVIIEACMYEHGLLMAHLSLS